VNPTVAIMNSMIVKPDCRPSLSVLLVDIFMSAGKTN
jgi:hypothetical protein